MLVRETALLAFLSMLALGTMYKLGDIRKIFSEKMTILFKGAATSVAGAMALYAAVVYGGDYAWWVTAGLFLCAVADMVLEKNFIGGMVVFAMGHVGYIGAFISSGGLGVGSALLYLVLLAFVFIMARVAHQKTKQPTLHLALYGAVICLMVALAVPQRLSATIGALLFVISDAIIAYRILVRPTRFNDLMCIVLYYFGQFLLGYSALLNAAGV